MDWNRTRTSALSFTQEPARVSHHDAPDLGPGPRFCLGRESEPTPGLSQTFPRGRPGLLSPKDFSWRRNPGQGLGLDVGRTCRECCPSSSSLASHAYVCPSYHCFLEKSTTRKNPYRIHWCSFYPTPKQHHTRAAIDRLSRRIDLSTGRGTWKCTCVLSQDQ